MFLSRLSMVLTTESKGWRDSTVILMDGATYHKASKPIIEHLGLRVVLSAGYSFAAAPAELFFSMLKRTDMNPDRIATGKR